MVQSQRVEKKKTVVHRQYVISGAIALPGNSTWMVLKLRRAVAPRGGQSLRGHFWWYGLQVAVEGICGLRRLAGIAIRNNQLNKMDQSQRVRDLK